MLPVGIWNGSRNVARTNTDVLTANMPQQKQRQPSNEIAISSAILDIWEKWSMH
jgi:hypothetical protein